jgi:serine/threonine-protein kinase
VKGKIAYMAPEQARGGAVDARADVFSLGVIVWELCTGRRLLARDSDAATLAAVLGDDPLSPPSAWNEEVPPELDQAVLAALERDPERRTRSAQDLATALSGVLLGAARSPEDVDLRAFVHRLFPDEVARASSGATAQEPTRVRQAREQAEPAAEAAEPAAGPEAEAEAGAAGAEESATRTAAATEGRRARRRRAGIAAAAFGAALAVGAVAWRAGIAPTATPTATSTPTSTPTPTSDLAPTATPTPNDETPLSIPAAAAVSDPAPAPSPPEPGEAPGPAGADAGPLFLEVVHEVGVLKTPRADSGEGILLVNATPWGRVVVDGTFLGDSPREMRIRAGRHRVRVDVKGQRGVETVVTVPAGRRVQILR